LWFSLGVPRKHLASVLVWLHTGYQVSLATDLIPVSLPALAWDSVRESRSASLTNQASHRGETALLSTDTIQILNPLPGHSSSTSVKRAHRYIAKGRAIFVDEHSIRFIETSQRDIWRLQSRSGYDGVDRPLTQAEVAAIPVVEPEKLFAPVGRRHFRRATDGKNGKVKWLVRGGVAVNV
jgi:hypothetical protein